MDVPTLRRPWWEKHPEAADFVRGLFGTMRIVDMPAAIAAKFGPDVAPGKSSVARYMAHLRDRPGLGPQALASPPKIPVEASNPRDASKRPCRRRDRSRDPQSARLIPAIRP